MRAKVLQVGDVCPLDNMLQLDLPFIENVDLETILQIRANESDAFESFRILLAEESLRIQGYDDPTKRSKEIALLSRRLNDVEIRKVDLAISQSFKNLKYVMAEKVLAAAGLGFTSWVCEPPSRLDANSYVWCRWVSRSQNALVQSSEVCQLFSLEIEQSVTWHFGSFCTIIRVPITKF